MSTPTDQYDHEGHVLEQAIRWMRDEYALALAFGAEDPPPPCACDVVWDSAVGAWSAVLCTGCAAANDLARSSRGGGSGRRPNDLLAPAPLRREKKLLRQRPGR